MWVFFKLLFCFLEDSKRNTCDSSAMCMFCAWSSNCGCMPMVHGQTCNLNQQFGENNREKHCQLQPRCSILNSPHIHWGRVFAFINNTFVYPELRTKVSDLSSSTTHPTPALHLLLTAERLIRPKIINASRVTFICAASVSIWSPSIYGEIQEVLSSRGGRRTAAAGAVGTGKGKLEGEDDYGVESGHFALWCHGCGRTQSELTCEEGRGLSSLTMIRHDTRFETRLEPDVEKCRQKRKEQKFSHVHFQGG